MSKLCSQQEQSNSLISSPSDKILNDDKDADADNTEVDKDTIELSKKKSTFNIVKNQEIRRIFHKMYLILKEFVIISLMVFAYAALMNDAPKVSKSPSAFPFFPIDSVVTDWYHGQLSAAINKAHESDIAFVMFYAPWDGESQAIRGEFDLAARFMHKEVVFAAVNCWQPGSECRKQYIKAYSWPVLIAYPTHGKGIQYKGPNSALYIVKFLKAVTRPLVRISDGNDIDDLLSSHDSVVVGCVDVTPGSRDYAVFYNTALRFLERDPMQETVFAVISDLNGHYCNENSPALALHTWNETLLYDDEEWKSTALLKWILNNMHQVSVWLTPMGSKSLVLSSLVYPGPALILFTPRNPLDSFVDYYDLLHEVGLEYYNCGNTPRLQLKSLRINTKRKENRQKYFELIKSCSLESSQEHTHKYRSVVTYTLPQRWANNSCCLSSPKISEEKCFKCDSFSTLNERIQTVCNHFESCKHNQNHKDQERSQDCHTDDWRTPRNLQKLRRNEKCDMVKLARQYHQIIFAKSIRNISDTGSNVTGLACKLNSSLALIALDSLAYYHFAKRLGINVSVAKDKTVAVIINPKMEAHHILHGPVNDMSLRKFIVNFTSSNLPRSLNSEATLKIENKHKYSDQRDILELNTNTFFPTVMQDNKAVIVLYYSKQCSFCSGISYTLLTVAKILKSVNSLQFTRVDGDLNILPWAFTMDSYPTIILFPPKRKSESRVFPRDIPITIPNLINFILVNLNSDLRLHVMWVLCNQTKFEDEQQLCMASVRKENLSIINDTLRLWRRTGLPNKKKLLHKLQQLRSINLLLTHSSVNLTIMEQYLNRLHFSPTHDVQTNVEKKKMIRDEL